MKVLVEDLLLLARLDETRPVERGAGRPRRPRRRRLQRRRGRRPGPAGHARRARAGRRRSATSDHLRQAIANLVANAVRHTPAGTADRGQRPRRRTARPSCRCATTGPGLDDDGLAHVFDRFWQADRARTGTGAGLGLSIVAAIAAEHGGTVTAGQRRRRRRRVHHRTTDERFRPPPRCPGPGGAGPSARPWPSGQRGGHSATGLTLF